VKTPQYPPYSACPCDSKKSAKFCCQKGKDWNKLSKFNPELYPITNLKHNKCYLSVTNNCSSKISREHPITAGLLSEISPDEKVNISGLAWQRPQSYDIMSIKSLASNILCTRHNSWLSSLDNEAISLFTGLSAILNSSYESKKPHKITLLSGPDVESWMLKTILSLHFAKFFKNTIIPNNSIDVLTRCNKWPDKWGVYFEQRVGEWVKPATQFRVQLLHKNDNMLIKGVRFIISGFSFIFLMDDEIDVSGLGYYRTTSFSVDSKNNDRYVHFSWPDPEIRYDIDLTSGKSIN
jgi:hypothetical protein